MAALTTASASAPPILVPGSVPAQHAGVYRLLLADERPGAVERVWSALRPRLDGRPGVRRARALRRISDAGRRGLHPGRCGLELEISLAAGPWLEGSELAGVLYLEQALGEALAELGESLAGTSTWLERPER